MPRVNTKKSKTTEKKVEKKAVVASVAKKTVKTAPAKTGEKLHSSLSIEVFDGKGKPAGSIDLPKELFGAKIIPSLMAQAVRVYLANQRLGTQSTKTRGEVRGSTRKIYKQKGTGRARHGGIRAPIFVGGGIALGPKPRDFSLKMPEKTKRVALASALSARLKDGSIKVVSGIDTMESKTKAMMSVLDSLSLSTKNKKILFVLPNMQENKAIVRAAQNIAGVTIRPAYTLNTFEVLDNRTLLFLKEAIPAMEKHFVSKN